MDFSQSALLFDPSFQYVILHLLISVCTQFHHLFFWGYLLLTKLEISVIVIYFEEGSYTLTDTLHIELVVYDQRAAAGYTVFLGP